MLNLNNHASLLKRDILVQLAKLQLEGKFEDNESLEKIPLDLIPDGSVPIRENLTQDRSIVRIRTAANMGHSIDDFDESKPLSEYAKEALERKSPTWPMLTVIHKACNACRQAHYFPTDACQGCLARPCMMNCPKKAINVINHRARIDQDSCIGCGLCAQNCPYHAIIKTTVPCEEVCPVGAISKNESGRETIDYDKCIFCGKCMSSCPFSAMMGKSQLVDVIKHIMAGESVVAMYAPAIGAQFKAKPGQLEGALLQAGFSRVWEVAVGADITADNEAKEFEERMERGDKMMTTSCCPAYVRAVNIHVPELKNCISDTKSPMVYNACFAKVKNPESITVFIGPCLAKRREGYDCKEVDYVLTAEDLNAFFIAKGIDISKAECITGEYTPTVSGRNFAKSGGVAESVKLRLDDKSILRPFIINGLDKAGMVVLKNYGKINAGTMPTPENCPNLIEVMCCEGGCIAGPAVVATPKLGNALLNIYANAGSKPDEDGKPIPCNFDDLIIQ